MTMLGSGLSAAGHDEDALSVKEARLAMMRRLGSPESSILGTQSNIANTYHVLGRLEEALSMQRDVYSGRLKLHGKEDENTLIAANNCASTLLDLNRYAEAKSLLRETIPVARRVIGDDHNLTLKLRWAYAEVLYKDDGATLADLREAVTTLEEIERTARRVLGGAHPLTESMGSEVRNARAALRAHEAQSGEA